MLKVPVIPSHIRRLKFWLDLPIDYRLPTPYQYYQFCTSVSYQNTRCSMHRFMHWLGAWHAGIGLLWKCRSFQSAQLWACTDQQGAAPALSICPGWSMHVMAIIILVVLLFGHWTFIYIDIYQQIGFKSTYFATCYLTGET